MKYRGDTLRINEHLEVYFSIVLEERGETPLAAEDLRIIYEITIYCQTRRPKRTVRLRSKESSGFVTE